MLCLLGWSESGYVLLFVIFKVRSWFVMLYVSLKRNVLLRGIGVLVIGMVLLCCVRLSVLVKWKFNWL